MSPADLKPFDGKQVEVVAAVPVRSGPRRSYQIERTSYSGTLQVYPKGAVSIGRVLTMAAYVESVEEL